MLAYYSGFFYSSKFRPRVLICLHVALGFHPELLRSASWFESPDTLSGAMLIVFWATIDSSYCQIESSAGDVTCHAVLRGVVGPMAQGGHLAGTASMPGQDGHGTPYTTEGKAWHAASLVALHGTCRVHKHTGVCGKEVATGDI